MLRVIALVVGLAIAGCATVPAPTAAQLAAADYGAAPSGYQDAVHRYFDSTLKDPLSVQYREVTAPEKGFMQSHSVVAGTKVEYGWLVKATVNAKNSYGGYVGFKTYTMLFRGEDIIDTLMPDSE